MPLRQGTRPPVAELRTLSGPRLLSPTGAELLGPGKPLALLIYLACSPRRTAGRDHLVDLLWSDLAPDKARHALRQTLWYLRQVLGDSMETPGSDIVLATRLRLDRDEFLEAVNRGDLVEATEMYQGDFLSGFAVPGGLDFEQWADIERQGLRAAFLRAVERLTRRHLDAGCFREAVALARRGRDSAAHSERMWRLLLEALSAARDSLGVTLEASALRTQLERDQREPEPATRALLDRLDATEDVQAGASPVILNPALVGRESQFSAILQAWEEVRLHTGRHIHLTAGPGLGKSRLLGDVHRRLKTRGARTLLVRATSGDRDVPFSLAAEIARALAGLPGAAGVSQGSAAALVALNPTLTTRYSAAPDSATGSEAVRRRSNALSELLTAIAEEQPCALLLDDLHWADAASAQALGPLLQRVHETPVLIVTAARPVPGSMAADEVRNTLSLPPLTLAQIVELVGSLGTVPAEPWSNLFYGALAQATAGSPLLVLETLQLAIERGTLRLEAGTWACPDWSTLSRQLSQGSALRQRVSQLDAEAGRILLALAVAGTARSTAGLLRMTSGDAGMVERGLTSLEQRGLVQRVGDRWEPVHDEIAALALELAAEPVRRAMHATLGAALAATAEDRQDLVRAGRHLVLADRWSDLRGVFLQYVRRLRREGDGRRLVHLAQDFMEGMPDESARRLLRTLGRLNHLRYDLARPVVVVALAALGVMGVAAFVLSRPAPPDAVLVFIDHQAPASSAMVKLPVSAEGWSRGGAFDIASQRRLPLPGGLQKVQSLVASPDGRRWAATVAAPNGGGTDVVLIDGHDRPSELLAGPRDENAAGWLPDGSGVVVTTGHWSPPGDDDYDVGVRLLAGGFRRVTATPDHDGFAFPSPDGTRVALWRVPKVGRRQYCVVPLDGQGPSRCVADSAPIGGELVGWSDPGAILALRPTDDGLNRLVQLDLATLSWTVLLDEIKDARVSPGGRWLAYSQLRPGRTTLAWFIAPTTSPASAREVLGVERGRYFVTWQEPRGHPFLDRLELVRPAGPLPAHVQSQLRARPLDQDRRPLDLPVTLSWSSSDTAVASIDSSGLLRPVRDGRALVTVSASGWRMDTATVEIRSAPAELVLAEGWEHGLANWKPFGDPLPEVVTDDKGRWAFWNHGDGDHVSGAYSRGSWSGAEGFGVEVEVSALLTLLHWQSATVQLVGGLDSAALGGWDHRTGAIPIDMFAPRDCEVDFPSGEGSEGAAKLTLAAGGLLTAMPVDPEFRRGRWMRLRVQIFPDGTCGVAQDGRPLWRSKVSLPLDRPFAILLGMSSARTRVLHGHLEAWTGVRRDVDWPALGSHQP